jgi:hypothetical protein
MSGFGNPWDITQAQRQGNQGYRPGTMYEALQGPQTVRNPHLLRALNTPLDPATTPESDTYPQFNVPITWTSQTFNSAATENIIQAQPNRVVIVAQNLSPDNAVAVNFDQTASVSGTSPNYVSQGILLLPGVSLFIDKWCPTGTIHVSASDAPTVITQGYSAIGNIPDANLLQALWQILLTMQGVAQSTPP